MRNTGRPWETQLEIWHKAYLRRKQAHVIRTFPETRFGVSAPTGVGPPDFVGWLAGGRSIIFDAKDYHRKSYPFEALPGHQEFHLRSATAMGAIAFLALRLDGIPMIANWADIEARYLEWSKHEKVRGSVNQSDCILMNENGWIDAIHLMVGVAA